MSAHRKLLVGDHKGGTHRKPAVWGIWLLCVGCQHIRGSSSMQTLCCDPLVSEEGFSWMISRMNGVAHLCIIITRVVTLTRELSRSKLEIQTHASCWCCCRYLYVVWCMLLFYVVLGSIYLYVYISLYMIASFLCTSPLTSNNIVSGLNCGHSQMRTIFREDSSDPDIAADLQVLFLNMLD